MKILLYIFYCISFSINLLPLEEYNKSFYNTLKEIFLRLLYKKNG